MKKIVIGVLSVALLVFIFSIVLLSHQRASLSLAGLSFSKQSIQGRPFYMGFSTWPPDATATAVEQSFTLTNANSDLRLVHLDAGVPWVEMSQNFPLPQRIQNDWNYAKSKSSGKKLFIAINPLNLGRDGMALYANSTGDNQPLPTDWQNLALNDSKVEQAYLNYAKAVVSFWNPNYLAIGIEANVAIDKNFIIWQQYLDLHTYVYTELKKQYPNLPIFATIQLEHFKGLTSDSSGNVALQTTEVGKLFLHSDIAALSIYPYMGGTTLTNTYFDAIKSLNKPLAISETGWPSQSFTAFGINFTGSTEIQKQYLSNLLGLATTNKFVFLVNWVNVDYDKLLQTFPAGTQELSQLWVHDGLWDSNFVAKPALQTWQTYLKYKKI